VAFNSLDRSPNGALIRSPLGAFNGSVEEPLRFPGVVTMVWIDESEEYHPFAIATQQHEFRERVAEYAAGAPRLDFPPHIVAKGSVQKVATSGGGTGLLGGQNPDLFVVRGVSRNPTMEENLASLEQAVLTNAGPLPGHMKFLEIVRFAIDTSVSMEGADVLTGLNAFRTWLLANRGRRLIDDVFLSAHLRFGIVSLFGDEQWIRQLIPLPLV
jgi:hypothetical protein